MSGRGVPLRATIRRFGTLSAIALLTLACIAPLLTGCASDQKKSAAKSDADRYLRLAYIQMERGQTQQAMDTTKQALSRDPDSAEAHNFLGLIYLNLSQPKESVEHLREAVRLNPYFSDAHNNLGVAYRESKEYDKAVKEFELALSDRSYKSPQKVQLNLGHVYQDQGLMPDAIRSFQRALELDPKYLLGHLDLGSAYEATGKADLAAKEYCSVITLAPESQEAARARQLLEKMGKRCAA